MRILLFISLLLASCSTVSQINLKTGVGNEIRDAGDTYRFGAIVGPEIKFDNGIKTSVLYRHRITDFEANTQEHGFFLGATIPLWKKDQK